MWCRDNKTLKVFDFGLAKHMPPGAVDRCACGSPLYMAPEVINRERYSLPIDVWSIGVLVHEIFAGWTPFVEHCHDRSALSKSICSYNFKIELHMEIDVQIFVRNLVRPKSDRPTMADIVRN